MHRFCLTILLLFIGCAQTARPVAEAPASQPTIVGTWKAERVQTQLGPMTITYEFRADGKTKEVCVPIWGIPISMEGTYEVKGEELIVKDGARTTTYKHTLLRDTLTLVEVTPNGHRFDFKKQ